MMMFSLFLFFINICINIFYACSAHKLHISGTLGGLMVFIGLSAIDTHQGLTVQLSRQVCGLRW